MMKLKIWVVSLFLALWFYGCRKEVKNPEESLVIDLTESSKDTTLILEDIARDLKIIRLETGENCVIKHFNGHIGEKYLISMNREKVLQFSGNGKYIGHITRKGKGPGEFNWIDAWVVDENEQYFYYHDKGKDYINRFNLDTREFEKDVPLMGEGGLNEMIFMNDTVLALLRGKYSDYEYLYFFQSISGHFLGGKKKKSRSSPGAYAVMNQAFNKTGAHTIIYHPSESDIVFRIEGSEMKPLFFLRQEEPKKKGNWTVAGYAGLKKQVDDLVFFFKSRLKSNITPNSSRFQFLGKDELVYNRSYRELYRIRSVYCDKLGMELKSSLNLQQNNILAITYQAMNFKNKLEEALDKGEVPGSKLEKLNQLNSEISENDNPVIVNGKIR